MLKPKNIAESFTKTEVLKLNGSLYCCYCNTIVRRFPKRNSYINIPNNLFFLLHTKCKTKWKNEMDLEVLILNKKKNMIKIESEII